MKSWFFPMMTLIKAAETHKYSFVVFHRSTETSNAAKGFQVPPTISMNKAINIAYCIRTSIWIDFRHDKKSIM